MTEKKTTKTTPTAKKAAGVTAEKEKPAATRPKEEDAKQEETPAAEERTTMSEQGPAADHATEDPVAEDSTAEETAASAQKAQATPAPRTFAITKDTVIVIGADGVAADLLLRQWRKAAAPADIRIVAPATTLAETLVSLVADDQMPDEFIFVPGICFPTARVTLADLTLYRRRVLPKGATAENTGLPMLLTKEHIVDALRGFPGDPTSDERVIGHYNEIAHAGEIPNHVAFSFGNAVGYVMRPDFCPAVLIDFLRGRKFVCVAPAAFSAAKPYLEEYAKR